MDYIKELETLIKDDILIEINENIKDFKEQLSKKKSKSVQEELEYISQVKKYFEEVLLDIENSTITQDQALDILEGLEDMKTENQDI
jgi:sugar-specific transcriptional regulator TrmB